MLTFLALSAAASALWLRRARSPIAPAICLSLCVAAMLLTHYFAAGTALALCAYLLIAGPRRWTIAAFTAAALIFMLSWGRTGINQFHLLNLPGANAYAYDDPQGHVARTLWRAALLPIRYLSEPTTTSQRFAILGAIAYLLPLPFLRRRPDLLLWALWLHLTILPIALLDISRSTRHLEFIRYTLLAAPALYAILSALLIHKAGWWRHVIPATVVLAAALALCNAYAGWWKADWKTIAHSVAANTKPGDVIIYQSRPDRDSYAGFQYLAINHYTHAHNPIVLLTRPIDERLLTELRSSPGVLLVEPHTDTGPAKIPGARLQWLAMEPGAARLWRVRFDR